MPYPESLIRAIADRHGLSGGVALLPNGGMVNEAWAIGDHCVLRIVKEGQDAECDQEAERETAVFPHLAKAGLTTPRLIATDLGFAPRPYTIYEKVSGELIGFSKHQYEHYEPAWCQLGRDLFNLHNIPVDDALVSHLHKDKPPSLIRWVGRSLERGAITQRVACEISETAQRLQEIGGEPREPCLIHNDIHPWNLMGDAATGRLTAIIDWGDATYGDPARDFAMMPLPCVPTMLDGYARAGGQLDAAFIARSILVGLDVALFEASTPEMSAFDRKWWRSPPGGWEEMKSLVAELWPELT